MTPETYVIKYLDEALPGVLVFGEVPENEPRQDFLTVELTGASITNQLSSATLAIDSWSLTRAQAMELSVQVKEAMFKMLEEPIGDVMLDTEYNNPRLSTKHPRYRTMWRIVYVSLD